MKNRTYTLQRKTFDTYPVLVTWYLSFQPEMELYFQSLFFGKKVKVEYADCTSISLFTWHLQYIQKNSIKNSIKNYAQARRNPTKWDWAHYIFLIIGSFKKQVLKSYVKPYIKGLQNLTDGFFTHRLYT